MEPFVKYISTLTPDQRYKFISRMNAETAPWARLTEAQAAELIKYGAILPSFPISVRRQLSVKERSLSSAAVLQLPIIDRTTLYSAIVDQTIAKAKSDAHTAS